MFSYIFESKSYSDTSIGFMRSMGMNDEQIESVMSQREYEAHEGALNKRQEAYSNESDPLFIEWQYEKTPESEQLWRNKVLEIKARYPIGAADA